MTFRSYSDHSEPIFNDLQILNLYKINEILSNKYIYVPIFPSTKSTRIIHKLFLH